ncbi:MAG: HEAT repeat domain-containing protein [Myxococcales bacterium]|nr:HEAT repeat domain-containing protein [Myxococcales bacterium]
MNVQQIGPYRVVRPLGEGGMGRVVEAIHTQIERRAAIKILHPQVADNPDLAARFLNEARSVNRIRHPGIVEIIDYGQIDGGTPYLVMEFLEGESLYQRLQRYPEGMPLDEALQIARQVALAVAAAHEKGIIHRDLKPENIMIVPDPAAPGGERVKVLDFGIAKLLFDQRALMEETLPGVTMGTPEYMAPEQHSSAAWVTDRADVFSLGAMLYEMLSGQRPFHGPKGALARDPKPLRQLALPVPEEIALLVERMLARDPSQRPVMAGVAAVLAEHIPGGHRRALPWQVGVGLLALVVLAVLLGPLAYRRLTAPPSLNLAALRQQAVALLQADLRSGAAQVRRGALLSLGQARDVRLRPVVEPLLKDADAGVQAQAAEVLGLLGDRGAIAALLALLQRRPPPEVQVAAAAALDQLGDARGRPLLRQLMEEANEAARLRAALILGGHRDPEALRRLQAVLQRGGLPDDLTVAVLVRLGQAGDEQAKQMLLQRLQTGPGGEMRLSVGASLARLGEEQGRVVLHEAARRPGAEQVLAARLLAALGEQEPLPLLRNVLVDSRFAVPARVLAAEGLGDGGQAQDGHLLAPQLRAEPVLLRQAAARAVLILAGSDPDAMSEQSLAWARVALGDESAAVREAAVAVLGDAEGQAVALLGRVLREDKEPLVRRGAARTLGRLPDAAAVAPLVAALDDADTEVRKEAIRSLGRLGQVLRRKGDSVAEAEVRQRLGAMVRRGGAQEQVVARAALLHLGDESQRGPLRSGLDSPDPQVRRLVVEQADLDGEVLLQALSDTDLGVRWIAARKLASRGDRRAAPALRAALLLGGIEGLEAYGLLHRLGFAARPPPDLGDLIADHDARVRLAAVEAMAYMPPRQAVALLWRAAYDPESAVRRMVVEVAADLPSGATGPLGAPVLRLLRTDPDASVRARANLLLLRYLRPEEVATRGREPPPATTPEPPPLPSWDLAAEIDRLVREGVEAYRRRDHETARRRLEEAHALCIKAQRDCGELGYDLGYLLGRLYALASPPTDEVASGAKREPARRALPPARTRRSTEQLRAASPQGRVRLSWPLGRACHHEVRLMPVGRHVLHLGGRAVTIQVRANETVTVDACTR